MKKIVYIILIVIILSLSMVFAATQDEFSTGSDKKSARADGFSFTESLETVEEKSVRLNVHWFSDLLSNSAESSEGEEDECTVESDCDEGEICVVNSEGEASCEEFCAIGETECSDGEDNDLDGLYDFLGACEGAGGEGVISICNADSFSTPEECESWCTTDGWTYVEGDTECLSPLDNDEESDPGCSNNIPDVWEDIKEKYSCSDSGCCGDPEENEIISDITNSISCESQGYDWLAPENIGCDYDGCCSDQTSETQTECEAEAETWYPPLEDGTIGYFICYTPGGEPDLDLEEILSGAGAEFGEEIQLAPETSQSFLSKVWDWIIFWN
jgi:hypothetical protein